MRRSQRVLLCASLLLFVGSAGPAGSAPGEEVATPPLTAEDKNYLGALAADFTFDPATARPVRITLTVRDVWGKSRTYEQDGWYVPAKDGRPARAHLLSGEYYPAPAEETLTKREAGPTVRERLRLPEKRTDEKEADAVFAAVQPQAVRVTGQSDLLLAAWLYRLGEEPLAARALARARLPIDPGEEAEKRREALCWPAFADAVHAYMVRADDEALMHAERLVRLYPPSLAYEQGKDLVADLRGRRAKGTFGKPPAEALPVRFGRWETDKQVAYLIDALDEVDPRQWGQPGGVPLGLDWRVEALIDVGDLAVPALIDVLEKDDRLTRSVHFWRDFAPSRTVLGVREAALTALMSILRVRAFEARATGDNFTSRGKEHAARRAKDLRAYWAKYGGKPYDDRMMAVLTDAEAAPPMWREAATNLARLGERRILATTIELLPFAEPREGPNPAVAKFKEPTVAEAILTALDRDLKAHDAADRDDWHDYKRREIEAAYVQALVELQDRRIAAPLVRRAANAETIRLRRQFALAAHRLGDGAAIRAFADLCRDGKAALPAKTKYTSPEEELWHVLATLADARLPEADRALFAVADAKHPWHETVAAGVRGSRADRLRGFGGSWLFHPYCLPILRPALDDVTPTGATLAVEDGRVSWSSEKGWSALEMPAILRDPAVRKAKAAERRCDEAAANVSSLTAGVPAYHPLLKDADDRLPKLKAALDRFPRFRRATDAETAVLRPPADRPENFVFDYTRQGLFVPAVGLLDRPATADDVKAGRAVFHLDGKGKPTDLHLPAFAFLKKGERPPERVLIVQAEAGPDGAVTYGVVTRHDVRTLAAGEVENVKSIRAWVTEREKDR